jgi:two-component system chemotaxis response regulator CheY
MDITMPVLDGISALQKIRMINSSACVIMISALGQEIKIIESMNKGAMNYIIKPFKEQDVINRVKIVLNDEAKETSNASVSS